MRPVAAPECESRGIGQHALATWLVAGYLVLFLIRPWEVLMPALAAWRVERIYAIVMVIVVLLAGQRLRGGLTMLAVLGMACAAALSACQAWRAEPAWPALYQYLTVVVTFFVILGCCRRLDDLLLLVVVYLAAMFAYLGKALWEYQVHGRHWHAQGVSRLVGIEDTYGEPNALAMSVVLSLPWWCFLVRCRHELEARAEGPWRALLVTLRWGYPLLAVASVGLTNSRAGMVGLVAFLVGAIWWGDVSERPGRKVAITLALLVGLFVMAPDEQWARLRTLWRPDLGPANARASADGRWAGFLAGWHMFQDHPVTGVGLGNFLAYRITHVDGVGLIAHNLPGQLLGEMGLVGIACFTLLVASTWRDARDTRRLAAASCGYGGLSPLYPQLAAACQFTVLLLFLFGLSLHNGLRYNWLWVAAFAELNYRFCVEAWEASAEEWPDEEAASFRDTDDRLPDTDPRYCVTTEDNA